MMNRIRMISFALAIWINAVAAGQQRELVPESVLLAEIARQAIDAEWLTDEERRAMRIFHGVWDDRDLTTPTARAILALNAWDFDDPALQDETAPVEIRAEAKLRAGEPREAIDLLQDATSNHAARIRAEAFEELGELEAADRAVDDPVRQLLQRRTEDPADLAEGVRALLVRSRVEGQPARHYQTMMNLLARAHQQLDRLYWPSRLTEAELLLDKDNPREAVGALHETLALNPRCAEAWHALGAIALQRFDFDSVQTAADALRRLHPEHPLAVMLEAEVRLIEDDPDQAIEMLEPVLRRYPKLRPALALQAAAHAVRFDEAKTQAELDAYDELSPDSAKAYALVGKHLSFQRQYEWAARMLEEAVERQPAWPKPQIDLALLELQSGRDGRALAALRNVTELDPFNKRAANSLLLLEELAEYAEIESEHFIVRYKPGEDQVMAELMPPVLERIHEFVAGRFEHEPDRKTVIELLPDHERFGVRITGMPHIHTIAACTGPVIALEVPREGPPSKHLGLFDWPRVIQHEYTHTITLSQTRNRIPHWLTEAAAVLMEPAPRDYDRCKLLAEAYLKNQLFELDEINWAFIRPRRPTDRQQAYAQGHWMVEYMTERFGASSLIRLLERYFEGEQEATAMQAALGVSREEFFDAFKEWAGKQVHAWGMAPKPSMQELADRIRETDPDMIKFMAASRQARLDTIARQIADRIGEPARGGGRDGPFDASLWPELLRPPVDIDDETLAAWRQEFPDHPDLMEMQIQRAITGGANAGDDYVALLHEYAAARPVDPLPHRELARILEDDPDPAAAILHLEYLDAREQKSPIYALELAVRYRAIGQLDRAMQKAMRAVNIDPYNATIREQYAAAIALQMGDLPLARQHIVALTILEPDRPHHQKRLQQIDRMIAGGRTGS